MIESDFIQNGVEHIVVNSSSEYKKEWMNLGDASWATRQLYEIYKHANKNGYDYIFVLYGDVSVNSMNMSDVIKSSIARISNNPCSIYTKSFTYNHWGSPHTIIKDAGDKLYNICATDFSFIGMHKDTYKFIFNFLEFFKTKYNIDEYKSAWGFDQICWIYSMYNKKEMYRDCDINLIHDIFTTGYEDSQARHQMEITVSEGFDYMASMGYNKQRLIEMRQMLNMQYASRVFSYDDFYKDVDE
jgi:hypothetical protein